jgi:hypothetical protein
VSTVIQKYETEYCSENNQEDIVVHSLKQSMYLAWKLVKLKDFSLEDGTVETCLGSIT